MSTDARTGFWFDQLKPEEITKIAEEWWAFERNSRWHARLGVALEEAGHLSWATTEMEKAVAADESDLRCRVDVATIYARQRLFQKAVDTCRFVLANMASTMDSAEQAGWWDDLRVWSLCLCDYDEAVQAARKQYSLLPTDPSVIRALVEALDATGRYEELGDLLIDLSLTKHDTHSPNQLIKTVHKTIVQSVIFKALEHLQYKNIYNGRLSIEWKDFGMQIFDGAIAAAEGDSEATFQRAFKALALLMFEGKDSEAIRLWIDVLESYRTNKADRLDSKGLIGSSLSLIWLSDLHLNRALVYAKSGSQSYTEEIQKLETLSRLYEQEPVNDIERDYQEVVRYGTEPATQALGTFYLFLGLVQKSRACFQPAILQALEMLSDDTPKNDVPGFSKLACILLHAGDVENATAAYAVTMVAYENYRVLDAEARQNLLKRSRALEDPNQSPDTVNPDIPEIKLDKVDESGPAKDTENASSPRPQDLKNSDSSADSSRSNILPAYDPWDFPPPPKLPDDPNLSHDAWSYPPASSFPPPPDQPNDPYESQQCLEASDPTYDPGNFYPPDTSRMPQKTPLTNQHAHPQIDPEDLCGITTTTAKLTLTRSRSNESLGSSSSSGSIVGEQLGEEETEFQCAGPCGRLIHEFKAVYVCHYCLVATYCDECHASIQAGTLGDAYCRSWHPHLQIYPLEAGAEKVASEREGGKLIPRREWVERLKEEWKSVVVVAS